MWLRVPSFLLLFLFSTLAIFPQGLPYFSSYSVADSKTSLYEASHLQTSGLGPSLSIPYTFPNQFDLNLPNNSSAKSIALPWDAQSQVQVFSQVVPFTQSFLPRNPEGEFDQTRPGLFRNLSVHNTNVTYVTYRRGVSFDMSLSVGLSLNHGGLTYMDVAESKFRVSYRLNRNIFSFLKNSKWEIFLQLSEMHRFDNEAISRSLNTALRMQEPSRSNFVGRQIYVSPGISISNSNLIFEGMVKVPINAREANRTLDDLWSPEVQGNLGLKYLFPVRSSR